MGPIVLLSLTSALNPTLIAATTVMLLLRNPKRLMLGYLLGALMTNITIGLVIVFVLEGNGEVSTTQHTLSPGADLALGAIALIAAAVLVSGRTGRALEHRHERKAEHPKGPPRWQRAMSRGSPRTTFVIGAL